MVALDPSFGCAHGAGGTRSTAHLIDPRAEVDDDPTEETDADDPVEQEAASDDQDDDLYDEFEDDDLYETDPHHGRPEWH